MAPGTRRANRSGYVEHDDFEGLPVRQWRHEWVNVTPPVQQEQQQQNDIWAIELIHGMPKDATLLPPHTQELLRAARSGRLYKRPHPTEDEEADGETTIQEKPEKKEEDTSAQGYQIRIWKQLPKNVEAPGISHLAKRRKNTVTVASRTVEERVQGPMVTRATVRRMDAAGNPYTEEVTLSEGQRVDGEVISTRVEAISTAQPDAFSAAPPAAARRRPPPPKRKAKAGPGRGKKKMRQPLSAEQHNTRAVPAGTGVAAVVKTEGKDGTASVPNGSENQNPESEMGDVDGDDDDDEDEDEGDDGEEGDEGEGEGEGDETGDVELQDESILDATKDHDEEMVDASHIIHRSDIEMTDEQSAPTMPEPREPSQPSPPKPSNLTVEPPSDSPISVQLKHEESPPRNPVIVPSPPAPSATAESAVAIALPVLDTPADNTAGSMVAEPPSTIVGEAPQEAIERDIPQAEETLLPPPDQVGNISSPKDEDENSRVSDEAARGQVTGQSENVIQKPVSLNQLSTITEDTIKPEDSVSVTAPMPGSEAPSEVGNASVDDVKEEAVSANTEAASTEAERVTSDTCGDAHTAKESELDVLGDLMGELDHQSAASQLLQQAVGPDTTSATETKPESPIEPSLPSVPEPEAETETATPVAEEVAGSISEPEPQPEALPLPEPEPESKPELEPESKPEPESTPEPKSEPVPEEQPVTPPVKPEPSAAEEEMEGPPANA
ncbi:hypothetical protein V8C37DRAFT_82020 [Trichoderma ceciliae]